MNFKKCIEVKSSEFNKNFKQFKRTIKDKNIKNKIKEHGIKIKEHIDKFQSYDAKNHDFSLELIGQDGSILLSRNVFNDNTFNEIFDKISNDTVNFGEKSFKEKYLKYKNKYMGLKYYIDNCI